MRFTDAARLTYLLIAGATVLLITAALCLRRKLPPLPVGMFPIESPAAAMKATRELATDPTLRESPILRTLDDVANKNEPTGPGICGVGSESTRPPATLTDLYLSFSDQPDILGHLSVLAQLMASSVSPESTNCAIQTISLLLPTGDHLHIKVEWAARDSPGLISFAIQLSAPRYELRDLTNVKIWLGVDTEYVDEDTQRIVAFSGSLSGEPRSGRRVALPNATYSVSSFGSQVSTKCSEQDAGGLREVVDQRGHGSSDLGELVSNVCAVAVDAIQSACPQLPRRRLISWRQ